LEYGVQRESNQEVVGMIIDEWTQKRWDEELYTICSFCETQYTFSEFMKCKSPWIDKKKKQYGKTTLCKCGVDLFDERWSIVSKNDNYFVMTIHLPIAVGGVEFENWSDRGFWYETMFWQQHTDRSRKLADFQKRYHNRDEAIQGHKFVVENLTKIVEHPESFPQAIISMLINSIKASEDQRKNIDPHVKRNLT